VVGVFSGGREARDLLLRQRSWEKSRSEQGGWLSQISHAVAVPLATPRGELSQAVGLADDQPVVDFARALVVVASHCSKPAPLTSQNPLFCAGCCWSRWECTAIAKKP